MPAAAVKNAGAGELVVTPAGSITSAANQPTAGRDKVRTNLTIWSGGSAISRRDLSVCRPDLAFCQGVQTGGSQ